MTVNGEISSTATGPARWRAPVQCPGTGSGSSGPVDRTPAPVLPVEEPRESEAGILVQAYSDGNASLEQSHQEIEPACESMVRAYWTAETEIKELQRFADVKYAHDARLDLHKVSKRHANDGPEDRRHQPKWLSPWLIWPVFLASALYDTVFIGDILQQMIDAGPGTFEYYAAYFPGIGIMVGLLVTASLLGTAHVRRRIRLERRRIRLLIWGKRERSEEDLPWPLWTFAICFAVFVLGTLLVWALIRSKLSGIPIENWNLSQYQVYSAILLLLLSVSAIALRVIAHNPYAVSDKSANEKMGSARGDAEVLRRKATSGMAQHAQTWAVLQAALAGARSRAERFVEAGRARILELRAEKAATGEAVTDAMTPMTLGLWHVDVKGETTTGPKTVDLAGQLRLHYEVLGYAEGMAKRHTPEKLEGLLKEVDDDLRAQFSVDDNVH